MDPDYVVRDKKTEHGGVTQFLGFSLLLPPSALLLPFSAASLAAQKMVAPTVKPKFLPVQPLAARPALKDREFDIVLFGATGFAGGLAARYCARTYGTHGKKIRWAIAGRREAALKQLLGDLEKLDPECKSVPYMLADSGDYESLKKMALRTRVVVTTVGPFQVYGTDVVRACIETGASYCDITGEADWVKGLVDHYDDAARQTGSRIVSFAGHDCIPWDLLTMKCGDALKAKGEEMASIDIFDEVVSKPSGGTLATVFESIPPTPYRAKNMSFNPFLRLANGEKSAFNTTNCVQRGISYKAMPGAKSRWTTFFIMADVMCECVKRSNALNGYGHDLRYHERHVAPGLLAAISRYLMLVALGAVLGLPEALRFKLLPAPGLGPSEAEMDRGFLQLTAVGTGSGGSQIGARIYFKTDPGYRDTARMVVEAGLAIALSPERMKSAGGILTPAACQGDVLLERLCATGTEFAFLNKL
jgi:short subunit dehydrogenase-like uncharacterized protein